MFTIGAFAVIFDPQGRVLLCHRRDIDLWNLPGGGLEGNELPTEAALREVREETGLEVEIERLDELLAGFDEDAVDWSPVIAGRWGADFAGEVINAARLRFEALLPRLPYIGGDENHLTGELLRAVRCLALYQAMQAAGKSAAETGEVLYAAILTRPKPALPLAEELSEAQLMERRQARAQRSQQRRYPGDWVYEFVAGDGQSFDYGYNFSQCAAQLFFRAQGAEAFLPFFCRLDFAFSRVEGEGLERSLTLAEGDALCNPRFKRAPN